MENEVRRQLNKFKKTNVIIKYLNNIILPFSLRGAEKP